ncbi:MAG: RecX family transcriptional regulator [Acetobacteraceae bacterium]|nr:RecX family transcriptional regulator [Acetobacteraceae bacterium]
MSGSRQPPPDPLDLAARLLAVARTRADLVRRLVARGVDPARAEAVAEECRRRGWLDDAQYARDWLERELGRRPSGRRRLRAALLERGVPPEVADRAVAEALSAHPEEALARSAAAQWRRARAGSRAGGRKASPASEVRGLAAFLDRRGFEADVVWRVLEESGGAGASPRVGCRRFP